MEPALKQRLVGAAVIIALGIIVIPMILDGAGERQLRKMPDAPEPSRITKSGFVINNKQEIKLPEEPAKVLAEPPLEIKQADKKTDSVEKEVKATDSKSTTASTTVVNKTVEKPRQKTVVKPAKVVKPDEKPVVATKAPVKSGSAIQRWVVQVGSFTDAKKAFGLRDDLRKKRYKAFVEKISGRTGQKMYRVRIGPVTKRVQADSMSLKLKTEGIKSFITRHP